MDLIHMSQYDTNWSNWVRQHNEQSIRQSKEIQKKLYKREMTVLNIYITPYPPVDDELEFIGKWIHPTNDSRLSWYTLLLDKEGQEEALDIVASISESDFTDTWLESPEEQDVMQYREITHQVVKNQKSTEVKAFSYGKPIFTYIFIAVQIFIFGWMEMVGSSEDPRTLLDFGAKFNPLILDGEWHRFLTPIFIHIGIFHLIMNTFALYYLGMLVERIYGSMRFLFIYMVAGLIGSIASFAFSPSLSAGASGAIFGCFGALLYFGIFQPKVFFRTLGYNIFIVIAINLALGFTIPGIDNAGHIGGLIGGFVATGIVHFPKKNKLSVQLLSFILTVGIGVGLLYSGAQNGVQAEEGLYLAQIAQSYIEEENFEKAYEVVNIYPDENSEPSAEIAFIKSYIEIQQGQYDLAVKHLEEAIQINPRFHEAYFNLSLLYYDQGKVTEAKKKAQQALKIRPSESKYKDWINELSQAVGGE
ncbi:rhomboid protease YqgP [Bacillus carboniphilus]|uniref:Rhomboid protease YqgP n=1 Tax=Bacillus carboniphilus TaxID=86663 RepID=A0ABP3GHI2_9BACI